MTPIFILIKILRVFFYSITVNSELEEISRWYKANKLSVNIKRTKFTLFHKNYFRDEIPIKLSVLIISNDNIERNS